MNHKIEIHSNNDSVETPSEMAELLSVVAKRLLKEKRIRQSDSYTSVCRDGSDLAFGTFRFPVEPDWSEYPSAKNWGHSKEASLVRNELRLLRSEWSQCAVTREGFVQFLVARMAAHGIDARNDLTNLLRFKKCTAIDYDSCRKILTKEFAHKAVKVAMQYV